MDFTNTTLINNGTRELVAGLLNERKREIENQYWKFEELEQIDKAFEQLGIKELKQ